ncbi:cytochrome p450 family 4 [Holotrichia oblita]|uniref:Cytochrome p450 family 4 n=1 Tax=Holotrichia oblita TaxID=644536 RepID=A0ACB9T7L2_HOLOL|nr:cytochrome p450 family 4 [Holotrichia oblita]
MPSRSGVEPPCRAIAALPQTVATTGGFDYTKTAMGIQVNAMSKKVNNYAEAVYGICGEISNRTTKALLAYDFVFYKSGYGKRFLKYLSTLHDTTNRVIKERKSLRQKQNLNQEEANVDDFGRKKRQAFLDLLIDVSQDGAVLTHEQIREEVDTFMFEGHDTTTASISWTIFLLGLHPNIQEKVYQEIKSVFQNKDVLEFSDINELKYLERVLKESLRLYPSVPAIARFTSEDLTIDDYFIPKGTTVSIHIMDIHLNPKYFPQPEKFDPDRFLPENSKDRHPYAYIPFSAGPRNCIGAKWHRHRKLLTPAFHFKILESFMPIFLEKSKLLVKLLEKEADGKTTFNIFPYITHCTLDIITETAMGIQINAMSNKKNSYVEALYGVCGEISNRMATGWLRSDFIFYNTSYGKRFLQYLSTLHGTTNRVVHERKDLRQKQTPNNENVEDEFGRKKHKAFLDILIDVSQDGTVLTNEQIREEVDTFMFEASDSLKIS